jgi:hypothetical protein
MCVCVLSVRAYVCLRMCVCVQRMRSTPTGAAVAPKRGDGGICLRTTPAQPPAQPPHNHFAQPPLFAQPPSPVPSSTTKLQTARRFSCPSEPKTQTVQYFLPSSTKKLHRAQTVFLSFRAKNADSTQPFDVLNGEFTHSIVDAVCFGTKIYRQYKTLCFPQWKNCGSQQ